MRYGHPGCPFGIVLSLSRWRHVDTHGAKIDHDAVPPTAADQPTTEPSAAVIETVGDAHVEAMVDAWGDEGGGYDFEVMARALIERGWTAPAPQPAADTDEK